MARDYGDRFTWVQKDVLQKQAEQLVAELGKQPDRLPPTYLAIPTLENPLPQDQRARELFEEWNRRYFSYDGIERYTVIEGPNGQMLTEAAWSMMILGLAAQHGLHLFHGTNLVGIRNRLTDRDRGALGGYYLSLLPTDGIFYAARISQELITPRQSLLQLPVVIEVDLKKLLTSGIELTTRDFRYLPYTFTSSKDFFRIYPNLIGGIYKLDASAYAQYRNKNWEVTIASDGTITERTLPYTREMH